LIHTQGQKSYKFLNGSVNMCILTVSNFFFLLCIFRYEFISRNRSIVVFVTTSTILHWNRFGIRNINL